MIRTRVILLFALWGCATAIPSPQPRNSAEGYIVATDSVQLFYRSLGNGADTVVVVHGFQGFGSGYMVPDLVPLAHGRVLIFFDQRGDGRSSPTNDPAQLDLETRVDDLETVRRHFGLERLTLLGHSGGAAVAARYAIEHPGRVEGLVLVAPPPPGGQNFGEQVAVAFQSRLDSTAWARMTELQSLLTTSQDPVGICREIVGTMLPRAYFAVAAAAERMRGDLCASPPERLRTQPRRTAAFAQSLPADWREDLASVNAPVLVVHGDHDAIPVASSRAWAEALPNGRLAVIADADHLPWVEQPGWFFSLLDDFFGLARSEGQ